MQSGHQADDARTQIRSRDQVEVTRPATRLGLNLLLRQRPSSRPSWRSRFTRPTPARGRAVDVSGVVSSSYSGWRAPAGRRR